MVNYATTYLKLVGKTVELTLDEKKLEKLWQLRKGTKQPISVFKKNMSNSLYYIRFNKIVNHEINYKIRKRIKPKQQLISHLVYNKLSKRISDKNHKYLIL